ncbi:CDP-alcohol phosphatidyltransferase family protein [Micromonosporaceae bacterium Da 78-11]
MQRCSLAEIRERTYKPVDAWWTVALVDPVASRLVRLVAPYPWASPNRLTGAAMVLGLAAAACFAQQAPGWLIAGALLFHLGFVIDCMDGKIARLNGTGSLFGAWVDFMFDRLRAIICAVALMGGQYARTGDLVYLWLATAVVSLDLLRYLNSAQMGKVRAVMRQEREVVYVPAPVAEPEPVAAEPPPAGRMWLKSALRSRRIRTHLVSGIEFEMTVFIIGPLTGWVIGTTVVAGVLLAAFELRLVYYLWRSTRRHARWRDEWLRPGETALVRTFVAEREGVRQQAG